MLKYLFLALFAVFSHKLVELCNIAAVEVFALPACSNARSAFNKYNYVGINLSYTPQVFNIVVEHKVRVAHKVVAAHVDEYALDNSTVKDNLNKQLKELEA